MPDSINENTDHNSEIRAAIIPIPGPRYLDKIQQAAELQITTRTLELWMRQGLVPYYKIGRTVRFDPVEVRSHFEATCRVGRRR